jgi:hypothetical protein
MDTFRQQLFATTADASEDRRAAAIRILLALADVDPTIGGATLVLPDGSVTHLDVEHLQRGRRA